MQVKGLRVALGHQARVGKDTFAARVAALHGAHIIAIAEPLYGVAAAIQCGLGLPVTKDPGLMQIVGTGLKSHYGEDVWVKRAIAKVHELVRENPDINIIVVDMRFPNEMRALAGEGFATVKIVRPDRPIDRDPNHISETALLDAKFDHVLENTGSLDDFYAAVDKLVATICA